MENIDWKEIVGIVVAGILIGWSYYSRWKAATAADKAKVEAEIATNAVKIMVGSIDKGEKEGQSAVGVKYNVKNNPFKTADAEELIHSFVAKLKGKGG